MNLGDKNTKYFYAATKARIARNRLVAIEDDSGTTHYRDENIGMVAESYFTNLFTTTRQDHINYHNVFIGFQKRVTEEVNTELTREVTEEEIRDAVFAIGEDRVPGPDGFIGAFYQQLWNDIKDSVIQEVKQFFRTRVMPTATNHTNICLIPKITRPQSMSDFRPIALCNVSYKIILKILVGRLKIHLSSIITENQAAFIPGRNIMDNVIMAHEMLHSLKSRRRWANSYMAVKTDTSKAYDRLEWKFLRDVMVYMGFDMKWIGWIMRCVESVSFSVLVNGSPSGHITPTRGIRQGDPLSPYLFILCSEVLSHLMTNASEINCLKGMKISTSGPTINHLLFADDALFFCHAHPKSCSTIMRVLREYEHVSGQAVNLNKSAITFGSRIKQDVRTRMRRILNIHNDGGGGKYLGLPEQIGRKKKEIFEFIVKHVNDRTQGWLNRYLSHVGKEILIKTVAMARPVYTMNCFKLPKGICDDINTLLARYWWKNGSEQRSMHWLAWKRLALPKKEGGLGFKDIESFNVAMLGKQAWKILQNPDSLLARLVKGRYFDSTNFLDAGLGQKPSFIWRSILEGRELLKKGLRVLIGDGENTNIWNDNWLPTHLPRPPRCKDGVTPNVHTVNEIMMQNPKRWNKDLIEEIFEEEDANRIQQIRITTQQSPDFLGWHYTDHGMYTVKSGYWLETHLPGHINGFEPPPGQVELKNAVWKLQTAPKLKHFLWRLITKMMAVGSILVTRRIIDDPHASAVALMMKHLIISFLVAFIHKQFGEEHMFFILPSLTLVFLLKRSLQ